MEEKLVMCSFCGKQESVWDINSHGGYKICNDCRDNPCSKCTINNATCDFRNKDRTCNKRERYLKICDTICKACKEIYYECHGQCYSSSDTCEDRRG